MSGVGLRDVRGARPGPRPSRGARDSAGLSALGKASPSPAQPESQLAQVQPETFDVFGAQDRDGHAGRSFLGTAAAFRRRSYVKVLPLKCARALSAGVTSTRGQTLPTPA